MAYQFSKVTNFIISVFDAMPLVNTISLRDDDVVDVEKANVYPMVNIRLIDSPAPQSDLREFTYAIEVLNQRDDTKVPKTSKLLTDTNFVDNINICDSIANNFILEVLKDHNDFNVFLSDDTVSEFTYIFKHGERNALEGVSFEVTLNTNNNAV